jgi:hypothetical protein
MSFEEELTAPGDSAVVDPLKAVILGVRYPNIGLASSYIPALDVWPQGISAHRL